MYIFIALIGFIILGFVSIFDKFILTKKVSNPAVYAFYASFFSLLMILLWPFGVSAPADAGVWALIFLDGLFFTVGLWFLFKGISASEISHIGPLVGAAVPFFTVLLSRYFLNEILSPRQMLAVGFLIAGSFLISFEKSKKHNGIHLGMLFGALSGLAFASSHVISKFLYADIGFLSGFVFIRVAVGVFGACLLLLPSVRSAIFNKEKTEKKSGASARLSVASNIILGTVGVILVQYAISLGSVSVVNSLEGARYGLLVILVFLLSKFRPKFFREEYTRGEIAQEIIAVLVICAGLGMLI